MNLYYPLYYIMDKINKVTFYMNSNKEFIYLNDINNEIIENYSKYSMKTKEILISELINCKNVKNIDTKVLHYYERPSAGITHCISKISTYLRLITKYNGTLIIPDNTNRNVINMTRNIFSNILILEPNVKYIFSKFIFSAYINLMDEPKIMKPNNKYPLIVYNNDIYWFRTFINKHIDFNMKKTTIYDKIFVGKFEGQGLNSSNLQKPRSLLGCIPKSLLEKFEKNGFKNIDPYEHHIHDIIYYIRHAKEIIFSCGSAGRLYLPYVKKETKIYYMMNITSELGITYGNIEYDYNPTSDLVQRFFPNNYQICFYKYAPHYDLGVNENNKYTGEDMLEFLNKD
jgi:hypothetical protein